LRQSDVARVVCGAHEKGHERGGEIVGLKVPVAVYTAASNLESALICEMLASEGIASHVIGDAAQFGGGIQGLMPWAHKPQVWVERADAERVWTLIAAFERQATERGEDVDGTGENVDVVCEECSTICTYPAARWGYVETCAHCGAYVDVGSPEEWNASDAGGE
jgi:hypothetical protein